MRTCQQMLRAALVELSARKAEIAKLRAGTQPATYKAMNNSKLNAKYTITLSTAADTIDAFKRLMKPGECPGFYARLDDIAAQLRNYAMFKPYRDQKPSRN